MTRSEVQKIIDAQRKYFNTGITKPLDFRLKMLKLLKKAFLENEDKLYEALKKDMNKPEFEAFGGEVGFVLMDIDYIIKRLPRLMRPERVPTPLFQWPGKSFIVPEPYGISLIIAPWNYPIQLLFTPLIGAIAGGNCAVLKPSSVSSNTSHVIKKLISTYFPKEYLTVVEIPGSQADVLLEPKYDMIFYTGSTAVGKIIMTAAAKHLTPVVLELGGKSPCIVDEDIDIEKTARRIVWGKFFNAGQTCISPDYVLVKNSVKPKLIEAMKIETGRFYGEDPAQSPYYCRIITEERTAHLSALIRKDSIVLGGEMDKKNRYLSPTILDNISLKDKIMQEEIFGPIMPVLEYKNISQAIEMINSMPKPLALYLFTRSKKVVSRVLTETSSGGVCINDTLSHYTTQHLPFGGVGESGMGQYHGKASFYSFTHRKSVLKKGFTVDYQFRYPPYMKLNKFLKKVISLIS